MKLTVYLSMIPAFLLAALLVGVVGCGGDPEVKKLISDLRDDDAEEREDAAKALENLGLRAAPAVEALGKCLSDEDEKVRYRAAKTLSKMGKASEKAVVEIGSALANDANDKVKYYAAKALVEIADQKPDAVAPVLDELVEALSSEDAKTRYYVVKTLGKVGAKAYGAIEEIEKLSEDSDKSVRNAVASAIKKIKKKHAES